MPRKKKQPGAQLSDKPEETKDPKIIAALKEKEASLAKQKELVILAVCKVDYDLINTKYHGVYQALQSAIAAGATAGYVKGWLNSIYFSTKDPRVTFGTLDPQIVVNAAIYEAYLKKERDKVQ